MPSFSVVSQARLATLDSSLRYILIEAIKYVDFSILVGYRGKKAQDEAVAQGLSKTPWPTSKHNTYPSRAVDVAPFPLDFADINAFCILVGYIKRVGDEKGVKLRLGADWDGNGATRDENFKDYGHIELT